MTLMELLHVEAIMASATDKELQQMHSEGENYARVKVTAVITAYALFSYRHHDKTNFASEMKQIVELVTNLSNLPDQVERS